MREKENKMNKKMSNKVAMAAIAILMTVSTGAALTVDPAAEFTLVNSASLVPNTMFAPEIVRLATPAPAIAKSMQISPAAIAAPQTSFIPRGPLNDFSRGERLEKTLFMTNLVAMVALNVADYVSTKQALKYPGLTEGNPMMKPFVKNAVIFAAVKAGTTVLSVWGMKTLWKRNKTAAWLLTTASNVLLSYVVTNNMRLLSKVRAR